MTSIKSTGYVPKITVGCDPEFVAEKDGQQLKLKNITNYRITEAGFGTDGHGGWGIGEIRPGQSSDLIKVLGKTEHILKEADQKFKLTEKVDKLLAGHYKYSRCIGGHIHLQGSKIPQKAIELGGLLDYFADDCLEGLLANQKERLTRKRSGHSYGLRADENLDAALREQSDDRIEYRTPGSWLLSPEIMYSYLYVGKACAILALKGWQINQFRFEPIGQSKRLKRERLEELITTVGKITQAKDMGLGAEILLDTIKKGEPDWNADFRIAWKMDLTGVPKKKEPPTTGGMAVNVD